MTDYAPTRGQNLNHAFGNDHLAISHYQGGGNIDYVYNNGQVHYSNLDAQYPPYPATCHPSQNPSTALYLPTASPLSYDYHPPNNITRLPTVPSQPRTMTYPPFYSSHSSQRPHVQSSRSTISHEAYSVHETESQDSNNANSMLSEPVVPPLDGYPDVTQFDELMTRYVQDLSPKKQDKALIHAKRATNIRTVLLDKKTTAVESAQFRFWVKKMFHLLPNDPKVPDRKRKICHEGKPVAVREKLFKILTKAHKQCQHGGRDKTSAQVRRIYSWVPKELISRFVKLCPTCQVRRGTTRAPSTDKSPPSFHPDTHSPGLLSPPQSRRASIATHTSTVGVHSPLQVAGASSTFHHQNRWMTPLPSSQTLSGMPGSSYSTMPQGLSENNNSTPSGNFSSNSITYPRVEPMAQVFLPGRTSGGLRISNEDQPMLVNHYFPGHGAKPENTF